jgi:phosphoglycerate dehydrogenase-like enzyme
MRKTLLVLMPFMEEYRRELEAQAPDLEIVYCEKQPPAREEMARASYIWGNPSKEGLCLCERLEWLQLQTAGFDAYSVPGLLPEGVVLTSCSGAYGLAISEYLVGVTLSLMKKLHLYRDAQRERRWQNLGRVQTVARSTVLVVGIGDIGGQYAQKMRALGASVSGVRRSAGETPEYLDAVYPLSALDDVLPRFGIVELCLPNNPETVGLFSRERIARMKPGAILLNIGRGGAVDTEALCDALESGALGWAGLDVMNPEPLPPDHRLWGIETALLTPHAAGGDEFGEIYPSIIAVWRENLRRLQRGETLRNVVPNGGS